MKKRVRIKTLNSNYSKLKYYDDFFYISQLGEKRKLLILFIKQFKSLLCNYVHLMRSCRLWSLKRDISEVLQRIELLTGLPGLFS